MTNICVYCMLADWAHKYAPWPSPTDIPWPSPTTPVWPQIEPQQPVTIPNQPWTPFPAPVQPAVPSIPIPIHTPQPTEKPWTREQYEEFVDILARIKDMEDRLGGCPCEDESKMDFLEEIKARLDAIDEKLNERQKDPAPEGCCGEGCCEHERRAEAGDHPVTSD